MVRVFRTGDLVDFREETGIHYKTRRWHSAIVIGASAIDGTYDLHKLQSNRVVLGVLPNEVCPLEWRTAGMEGSKAVRTARMTGRIIALEKQKIALQKLKRFRVLIKALQEIEALF